MGQYFTFLMKQKLLTEEYIFQESFPESLCLINQLSLGKKVKSINRVKWPTWVRITRSLVTSEAFVDDSNDNDGQDESTDHDDGEQLNGHSTVEDHTRSTTLLEYIRYFVNSTILKIRILQSWIHLGHHFCWN